MAEAMTGASNGQRALEEADEAFALFDVDGVVAHLSTAIREFTAADDKCRAAMTCVRLGNVFANMLGNLTAGRAWFARANRLVEAEPPCLEQGWAAVGAMGCDVDDPAVLLSRAELALDRARRFGDVNLETKALADAGLAHVQAGRIAAGMALLDEAMALVCGPADDTDTAAKSVCSFFTACYFAADFERAGSWADLLRQQGLISLERGPKVFLSSHCDSVHASLLVELGRWGEAEAVLQCSSADFERLMQVPPWHPDIALADLRVRQGRFAEAEVLLLGKDQAMQALLPTARLHLARGDHDLAGAIAHRGLRVLGSDRLRAVELLTILVDAELARGDVDAATAACAELIERTCDLEVSALRSLATAARSRTAAASGDDRGAIAMLEMAVDGLDAGHPWLRAVLLIGLARLRESVGDTAAHVDARMAAAILETLDVTLAPEDAALLSRLSRTAPSPRQTDVAQLTRSGKWWKASCGGSTVRLQDTKGLRYLAELVSRPGVERHAFDLVDSVEGFSPGDAPDRRSLGDAGEMLDNRARTSYRHRVEQLRTEVEDALACGHSETAEAVQAELDQLVSELARAFGLGGRDRRAASSAERARLNVTRALRAAITGLSDVLPGPAGVLDRRIRTGMYCAFEPADDDDFRWIVQSGTNDNTRH